MHLLLTFLHPPSILTVLQYRHAVKKVLCFMANSHHSAFCAAVLFSKRAVTGLCFTNYHVPWCLACYHSFLCCLIITINKNDAQLIQLLIGHCSYWYNTFTCRSSTKYTCHCSKTEYFSDLECKFAWLKMTGNDKKDLLCSDIFIFHVWVFQFQSNNSTHFFSEMNILFECLNGVSW